MGFASMLASSSLVRVFTNQILIFNKVLSLILKKTMNKHYNLRMEYWQLAKEPLDYLFSSAKFYESGIKNFVFLKDLRNEY